MSLSPTDDESLAWYKLAFAEQDASIKRHESYIFEANKKISILRAEVAALREAKWELVGVIRNLISDPWIKVIVDSAEKQDMVDADTVPGYRRECRRLMRKVRAVRDALAKHGKKEV